MIGTSVFVGAASGDEHEMMVQNLEPGRDVRMTIIHLFETRECFK